MALLHRDGRVCRMSENFKVLQNRLELQCFDEFISQSATIAKYLIISGSQILYLVLFVVFTLKKIETLWVLDCWSAKTIGRTIGQDVVMGIFHCFFMFY